MKTTFLLHGGRLINNDVRNDLYFQELTKDLANGDTLLHVAFARPKETWHEVLETERGWIMAQTDKKINVVMATHENFIEQIAQAEVIHITGGDSAELIQTMRQYPDFLSALRGKLIGGSSAGACLFSTYYWSGSINQVAEGLGTFPICLLVHYGSEEFNCRDDALDKLKSYSQGLELLKLEEAEWIRKELDI